MVETPDLFSIPVALNKCRRLLIRRAVAYAGDHLTAGKYSCGTARGA